MDAAIEAQDLGISRGRIKANTVIPHMTFSVETGSVTGLLGPSGCGKTTLMREGALLAHDTPAGLLRTAGTETLDDAFLALIKAQGK